MDTRERYFAYMETTIYDGNYLSLLFQKYHSIRRTIDIILAILSGGSLAAWLLYNNFAFWYATVIVFTQIATAVLPVFEVIKHEEALRQATLEFQPVLRQAEAGWRRIDRENLSEEEIATMIRLLESAVANILDKMPSLGIKDDKKISYEAARRTDRYMTITFQSSC